MIGDAARKPVRGPGMDRSICMCVLAFAAEWDAPVSLWLKSVNIHPATRALAGNALISLILP
jgi:hypothetical protein